MQKPKIFFMVADANYKASGGFWYRIKLVSEALKNDYDVQTGIAEDPSKLDNVDIIVAQRQQHPDIRNYLKYLKEKKGKIIIFEIDDNMWKLPTGHLASPYWDRVSLRNMREIVSLSHAVTTSTPYLAEFLRQFNPNVYIIPNYIDCIKENVEDRKPKRLRNEIIDIGFVGSVSHKLDFTPEIVQALIDIKNEYRYYIALHFMGYMPRLMSGLASYYHSVETANYMKTLGKLNLDIGIAPCKVNEFNNCKSNLKFLEYSAMGMVTIASPIEPYISTITNDMGYLLPDNKYETWYNALEYAINNTEKNIRKMQKAYQFVKENYTIDRCSKLIKRTYKEMIDGKTKT